MILNLESGSTVNSDNFYDFNLYVKFKLKPTGIMKKYCKNSTVREYKRRCNTIENSSLSERPSYPRPRDRDKNKELN